MMKVPSMLGGRLAFLLGAIRFVRLLPARIVPAAEPSCSR